MVATQFLYKCFYSGPTAAVWIEIQLWNVTIRLGIGYQNFNYSSVQSCFFYIAFRVGFRDMNVSREVGIVKPRIACRRRFFKDTSRTAKSKLGSLFLAPRTHQLKLSVSGWNPTF